MAKWTFAPGLRLTQTPSLGTTDYREGTDRDQNLLKAELMVGYALTRTHTLTATVYQHVDGAQAGEGRGLMIGVAEEF